MSDRREPMPSFLALPVWLWRRMTPAARVAATAALALVVVAVGLLAVVGAGVRNDLGRTNDNARAAIAAYLRADQAPRHGRVEPGQDLQAALELAIARDAQQRFARGRERPPTTCRRVRPVSRVGIPLAVPATDAYFTCFAQLRTQNTAAAPLETGYRFRARADLKAGTFAWCKLNPRPIHADQEEFVHVDLSEECVPRTG